jgi:hypothetical protein
MTEFNQLFDGGLAERVFFTFSIVFMLAYACGILFMRRTAAGSSRSGLRSRTAMMALFLAVAVSAVVGGLVLFIPTSGGAVNRPATLSISDLGRAVDAKSLPVQKMHDATFVFDTW